MKIKEYIPKLSILDRYLISQFAGPFILAIGGFALIAIVDILFFLVELAVRSGVSPLTILRLLAYKLPAIMILFFPMAVLFSVMLMLIRMAKDNELTILRASGIITWRIIAPVALMTIFATGLSYITNEKIVPWSNENSEKLIRREIKKKPPPNILKNTVFKDNTNRFFYIKSMDKSKSIMENIIIFEKTIDFPRITTAKIAKWNKKTWTLKEGNIYEFDQNGTIQFSDKFASLKIHVDQALASLYTRQKSAGEMDSKELKERIQNLDKGGLNTRSLKVEYAMKKSLPAACLIFGLIGIAFCINFVRSGKDWWGVITAICVAVLTVGFYFFLMAVFRALAKDGTLTPWVGAWLANGIYGMISISAITYHCVKK